VNKPRLLVNVDSTGRRKRWRPLSISLVTTLSRIGVPATIKSGQAGGAGSSRQIATSVSNLTLNQNL
jgi:hypothetical protein